jgi:hypothetical protein
MATTIGVSLDCTYILCTYPSDTILAFRILKEIVNVDWKNYLDLLLDYFNHKIIEVGDNAGGQNKIILLFDFIYI